MWSRGRWREGEDVASEPDSDPKALIERYCRDGDKQAFSRFYRLQSAPLWRYLRARGVDGETAYDLLSEAFIRFIQAACKDTSAPVALLYRIAINLHIDHYRRGRHAQASVDQVQMNAGEQASRLSLEDQLYLRRMLKSLPESEQNLLLLRYWVGMTHKEVAQVLQVPEGTIRRQCAATLKKLADCWEPAEHKQHEPEPAH